MSIGIRISNCIRIRISSGAILRAISCASGTLIGGKSVGGARLHRLRHKQSSGLVGGRLPDELAAGKCWANSGIEANYAHSLGAPKTCKSRTKSTVQKTSENGSRPALQSPETSIYTQIRERQRPKKGVKMEPKKATKFCPESPTVLPRYSNLFLNFMCSLNFPVARSPITIPSIWSSSLNFPVARSLITSSSILYSS
jgi:hypothetical protein